MRYGEPDRRQSVFGRTMAVILGAALVISPASPLASVAASSLTSDGALDVATNPPGAVVYVDGTFAGHTPLTIDSLSAGEHRVRITRNGYLENSRTVTVASDEPNALEVSLTPDTSAATAMRRAPGDSILGNPIFWAAVAGGGVGAFLLTKGGNKGPSVSSAVAAPSIGLASASSIAFSAQGASDPDGDTLMFSWDLGDGNTSTAQNPNHIYANAGNYAVSVTVSDGSASATAMTNVTIRDLTGVWDGDHFQGTVIDITQNGSTINGTYMDVDGPGTVTGFVQSTSPMINFEVDQPPFPLTTCVADPNANFDTFSCSLFNFNGTFTRR